MARKLESWLKGLLSYVEDTESPRQFWEWAGISTIASALQRKVWLPFGIETYYPNLYLLIVGPPASRKNLPIRFSKDILSEINIPVAADSGSKRSFTKELAETGKREAFNYNGKLHGQCALSVISKEMSSLLAVNPKEMIEVLTDVYDSHDKWDYKISQDEDRLFNVCVNCLIGTTPTWVVANLPQEAIGGGYTSRHIIVYGNEVYKRVSLPFMTLDQEKLYKILVSDLLHISKLVGEFSWGKDAYSIYDKWYQKIDDKLKETTDERLHPFIGRMHAMVLKTAMALRVDHSDDLMFTPFEIEISISMLEAVLKTAPEAFGGHGRSRTSVDTSRIMNQLKILKQTTFRELLRLNYRNTNLTELKEVVSTIQGMGLISCSFDNQSKSTKIIWLGKAGVKALEN